jgi:hypothetical protein
MSSEGITMTTSTVAVFDILTDFLTSNPSPEAVLEYQFPQEVTNHALDLMERNRKDDLNEDEKAELIDYVRADDIMTLMKAKTLAKFNI